MKKIERRLGIKVGVTKLRRIVGRQFFLLRDDHDEDFSSHLDAHLGVFSIHGQILMPFMSDSAIFKNYGT
jgi:hypothetical protein